MGLRAPPDSWLHAEDPISRALLETVSGEQGVGTLWVMAKGTRFQRPCWEEEKKPCASNVVSPLLFCIGRNRARVV